MRTFEIGHEGLGSAVQSVDDHFPISGASDLHSSILQARSGWGALPRWLLTYGFGLRREIEDQRCRGLRIACGLHSPHRDDQPMQAVAPIDIVVLLEGVNFGQESRQTLASAVQSEELAAG